MTITQHRLIELFDYDPTVGVFLHRASIRRAIAGNAAGEVTHNRYVRMSVDGRRYRGHHLAWLWVYGRLPTPGLQIDHIDGDTLNNRIANLREVTPAQNQQNKRRAFVKSATGMLGVGKRGERFFARIKSDDGIKYLGSFDRPDDAHQAYLAAKRELHPFSTI